MFLTLYKEKFGEKFLKNALNLIPNCSEATKMEEISFKLYGEYYFDRKYFSLDEHLDKNHSIDF